MAGYFTDPIKSWHLFELPRLEGRITGEGIDWGIFRACFALVWGRYLLSVLTPWFSIQISSGAPDFSIFGRWFGIRLYWGHIANWKVDTGGMLFTKSDHSLSFKKLGVE